MSRYNHIIAYAFSHICISWRGFYDFFYCITFLKHVGSYLFYDMLSVKVLLHFHIWILNFVSVLFGWSVHF